MQAWVPRSCSSPTTTDREARPPSRGDPFWLHIAITWQMLGCALRGSEFRALPEPQGSAKPLGHPASEGRNYRLRKKNCVVQI